MHEILSDKTRLEEGPAFAKYMDVPGCSSQSLVVTTYHLDPAHPSTRSGGVYSLCADGLKVERRVRTAGGVFRFEVISPGKILAALTNGTVAIVDVDRQEVSRNSQRISDAMVLNVTMRNGTILLSDEHGWHFYISTGKSISRRGEMDSRSVKK